MIGWYRHKNIFLQDGVQAFYLNTFLRNLYMAMTVIFTPIFIYNQGFKWGGEMRSGLLLVVAFYALQRVVVIGSVFPLSKLIERIGFRRSVAMSTVLLVGYTVCLMLASTNFLWLIAASVILGLQTPLYWIARDAVIAQDASKVQMGSQMGMLEMWEKLANTLGPLSGGLLVTSYGYPVMYGVAGVLLFLSIVPLWWMHSHSHKNGVSWQGFWYFWKNKRYVHNALANMAMAVQDYSSMVLWPLILFVRGLQERVMGEIFAGVGVITALVQYGSGKLFDKLRKRGGWADEMVYASAGVGMALVWLLRLAVKTVGQIALVDSLSGMMRPLFSGFYSDYMHLGGKRMGSIAYWAYLEVIYSAGALILFVLLAISIRFGIWIEMVILTAALWDIVAIVAARESNLR